MDTFLFLSLFELFFSVGEKIYRDQTLIKKKKAERGALSP